MSYGGDGGWGFWPNSMATLLCNYSLPSGNLRLRSFWRKPGVSTTAATTAGVGVAATGAGCAVGVIGGGARKRAAADESSRLPRHDV